MRLWLSGERAGAPIIPSSGSSPIHNTDCDTLTLVDSAFVRDVWIQERYVVSRPRRGVFTAEGRRSDDGGTTWIVTLRVRYTQTGGAS
jgi:hypothetical protein